MQLAEMIALLPNSEVRGEIRGPMAGVAFNSKTMEKGEVFFCIRGNQVDGHHFAAEAVARGAALLVVERFLDLPVPQVKVPDAREALARVARRFYGDPAARLGLVGVTGTNGKTTTAFLIRSVLGGLGRPVGMVGTVHTQLAGPPEPSGLTTPESADLLRLFARAVADGCDWLVMEVSSHALAMRRAEPADFDIGVVLNVTRDHFDFHRDFDHYWATKARLVREMRPERKGERPKAAVLCADDPGAAAMAREAPVPVITFGIEQPADVRATGIESGVEGSRFRLHLPGATPTRIDLPLPGAFNVLNALAAAAVGWLAGVDLAGIKEGLEACRYVPGRVERIDEGQPFDVLVDFAHNPDALARVAALRPRQPGGRTILLFGAEGGKDQGKRPLMGEAARAADCVIVTSDNMHREEPAEVARQITEGLRGHPHEVILDRREAIRRALTMARPGDLVIIAGKGHEQTWVWQGERIPFDDRQVAREVLRALMTGADVRGGAAAPGEEP